MMSAEGPPARRSVRLSALLGAQAEDIEITGLTADSRAVEPGYLFAALPGTRADGRDFIPQALDRGAAALLVPAGTEVEDRRAVVLEAAVPRRRFAQMAARFYGAQPATLAGVTGTNGKTSVASFTRQIWTALGHEAASVGTLGVESAKLTYPGGLTSPDPVALHRMLAELADAGVTHAALEASSHGLAQHRLDGLVVTAAAFTNLSRDHLDYHETVEAYFFAKARLFGELLPPGATAVINVDTAEGREMENLAWGRGLKILRVGRAADADLRLAAAEPEGDGQRLEVRHQDRRHDIGFPLAGPFQAENALLACGLAIACGDTPAEAIGALTELQPVPGRLEKVGESAAGGSVFIDYAHTPDGLRTVLTALRPHARGRLAVVFGCGGDRDRGKRPEMGRIAAELADRAIVTDDNPRSEAPGDIRADILKACPGAREIGDRREAIVQAVGMLGAGDVLVIAGKGHESGQIVGDRILDFSDVAVAREVIAAAQEGSR